ncbi:FHA domain-containing protein [Streptomyces sp. NPDC046182]|uniref:FHA domain-containing protein n=1 Tax=Streptomyces sp. NPDC046182 TaxID=3154601 RepID=UPI0033E11B04
MQIRLTVLAPHAGHGAGRACDVLVTAPAGTALAAVASGLAAAVSGPDTSLSGSTVLYAGRERLDARRCSLGEPPLVDGAVLTLQVPGEDDRPDEATSARLHVVAGPDAGGVHLLHRGPVGIGRSLDADVPLDDPDVSRVHCTVTVGDDGRVTVADLGSTNGTTLDGVAVGDRPVRLAPGALLRLGESALRLTGPGDPGTDSLPTTPDGEGHLRVDLGTAGGAGPEAVSGSEPGLPRQPEGAGTPGPGTALGGSAFPVSADATHGGSPAHARAEEPVDGAVSGGEAHSRTRQTPRQAAPPRGKRGIGAWARRFAGAREDLPVPGAHLGADTDAGFAGERASGPPPSPETWPDPAAVLLTALGPGPRLWERGPDHPEALVVRLGTTDRAELSGVPVTVGLREAGSLGLAGPGDRLAGLARSVVAQLAALHSPADLEIVLISADRSRSLEERRRGWGWLGWLPHLRPAHGQDCRLLLAYDRDQALARTAELTRRLDDGPLGPGWPSADRAAVAEAAARYEGPVTVVIVDGDPGSAALRETTARLAGAGAAAGIHLVCLAEAPAASPVSPVAATYESACAASLAFRECGAVALLSGDVATALRLLRTAGGRAAGHGTVGVVDAVSVAWAERFGRAVAPLRTDAPATHGRTAATALPRSSRLLDELGLARATPASLLARWAAAGDGTAVLGAGPRGPVSVDLTEEGPHLLIEGPAGSGRTELLRSIAASLAAGGRPDRLGLLLVDGAGGERGEGLAACTELPHVTEHLVASDPVRMREFAQALGAELKRRAEILGDGHFADRQAAARMIGQRGPSPAETMPQGARAAARIPEARAADVADRPSGRTLRTGEGLIGERPGTDTGSRSAGPGADDLTYHPSGRTSRTGAGPDRGTRPGADDLTYRPSGRTARTSGDTDPRTTRTGADADHRTGADDLTYHPSGRTARTSGDTDPRTTRTGADADHRTGADDLTYHPSGRTARAGDGSLGDRPSSRTPRPGADDLADRAVGRVARSAAAEEPGRSAAGLVPRPSREHDPRAGDEAASLPRLVVLVDDFDALVAPALGSPGRPAAGSVVRALEAVARGGARLGVHLVATSARPDRTADTELAHGPGARLRIVLDAPPVAPGPDDPAPGRGRLGHPDGRVTPFQAGRVTGRIPRTATLRPTVVPLEWERMGDPPTRRPVRELGNGPTDLALLASALDRAARSLDATPLSPLTPAARS